MNFDFRFVMCFLENPYERIFSQIGHQAKKFVHLGAAYILTFLNKIVVLYCHVDQVYVKILAQSDDRNGVNIRLQICKNNKHKNKSVTINHQ